MRESGLSESTTRFHIRSLEKKKDILVTVPPSGPTTPASYLIYSFALIITRRIAADLLYRERVPGTTQVRLITTLEAWQRWVKGEKVRQRKDQAFNRAAPPATPASEPTPAPAYSAGPAAKPAKSSVTPIARSSAIALKPEDWTAIHAALDGIDPANVTAEADLIKADLADNPGQPIQVTAIKVAGLVRQVRASKGAIHSPIAWMLTRIGSMVVDVEAEAQKAAAAVSADKAAETERVRREAIRSKAEKTRLRISPAAVEKGEAAWKTILRELEKSVIRQSFETWLKPTKGAWIKRKTLTVRVPSVEFQHIGDKYGDAIAAAFKLLDVKLTDVRFVAEGEES
jgi:hypothetical protein